MYSAKFIIVSEGSSIDQQTNSLSIFNIIEEIQAEGFPVLFQKVILTAMIEKEKEDADTLSANFKIENNGVLEFTKDISINFLGKDRSRLNLNFNGLVIKNPGLLLFCLDAVDFQMKYQIKVMKNSDPVLSVSP